MDNKPISILAAVLLFQLLLVVQANSQYSVELGNPDGSIRIADCPDLHLEHYTLECWVMITGAGDPVVPDIDSSAIIPLLSRSHMHADPELGYNYLLGIRKEDHVVTSIWYEGTAEADSFRRRVLPGYTLLLVNRWYHVAVTYNGHSVRLYVNGKMESEAEMNDMPLADVTGDVGIGVAFDEYGDVSGTFTGKIDAVRIWNVERTKQQILHTINTELQMAENGLFVNMNLNEGSGNQINSTNTPVPLVITGENLQWSEGSDFKALIPPDQEDVAALKIGLISDPQYCDCDHGTTRFYRKTLEKLPIAINTINQNHVNFTMTLGDIIDRNFSSFDSIMPLYRVLDSSGYYLLGNHEFEVDELKKDSILGKIGMSCYYYAFVIKDWRFLVLDGTELAEYASILHPELHEEADSIRQSVSGKVNDLGWNGGIGRKQQTWMRQQIDTASEERQKVIVFCHFPVYPDGHRLNLWNNREITELLEQYPNVVAFINGHNHEGDYGFRKSVHYMTHKAMVETDTLNSYSILEVYSDKIVQKGYGLNLDRMYSFHDAYKEMPEPVLPDQVFHYNTYAGDLIGRFELPGQYGADHYNYYLLPDPSTDNDFFRVTGDSLLLSVLPENDSKASFEIKVDYIDSEFDTSASIYHVKLDTTVFIQKYPFADVEMHLDSTYVVDFDSLFTDFSRNGLTYAVTIENNNILSADYEDRILTIHPLDTGNSNVIVQVHDAFTGYLYVDTFNIKTYISAGNSTGSHVLSTGPDDIQLSYDAGQKALLIYNPSSYAKIAEVRLYDLHGTPVKILPLNHHMLSRTMSFSISAEHAVPGLYLVYIRTYTGHVVVRKILIR
ncbi:MAG: metallophosphoesterase [Bacteroidales bacterium]|nr:metallophosphoesterase [Bacteroidales bacterium]